MNKKIEQHIESVSHIWDEIIKIASIENIPCKEIFNSMAILMNGVVLHTLDHLRVDGKPAMEDCDTPDLIENFYNQTKNATLAEYVKINKPTLN